ncbi:MAG TPA: hypothetical protein VJ044_18050, partial [Candidatus Hodarchaeales archaeon]|nr:hypothetical protein [Candidatus Hodarchaeales archaeon]
RHHMVYLANSNEIGENEMFNTIVKITVAIAGIAAAGILFVLVLSPNVMDNLFNILIAVVVIIASAVFIARS